MTQQPQMVTIMRLKTTQLGLEKNFKKFSTNTLTKWTKAQSKTWNKSSILKIPKIKKTI